MTFHRTSLLFFFFFFLQAILPPRKEFLFYCNLSEQQRLQYLNETNRMLCFDNQGRKNKVISDSVYNDEKESENENENEKVHKKIKYYKYSDCDNSKTHNRNKNKSDVKGVLPNIMKLRQICNFAEFTDFGIDGNGLTEFSNRECALQFLEHSAKLKVSCLQNIL